MPKLVVSVFLACTVVTTCRFTLGIAACYWTNRRLDTLSELEFNKFMDWQATRRPWYVRVDMWLTARGW